MKTGWSWRGSDPNTNSKLGFGCTYAQQEGKTKESGCTWWCLSPAKSPKKTWPPGSDGRQESSLRERGWPSHRAAVVEGLRAAQCEEQAVAVAVAAPRSQGLRGKRDGRRMAGKRMSLPPKRCPLASSCRLCSLMFGAGPGSRFETGS